MSPPEAPETSTFALLLAAWTWMGPVVSTSMLPPTEVRSAPAWRVRLLVMIFMAPPPASNVPAEVTVRARDPKSMIESGVICTDVLTMHGAGAGEELRQGMFAAVVASAFWPERMAMAARTKVTARMGRTPIYEAGGRAVKEKSRSTGGRSRGGASRGALLVTAGTGSHNDSMSLADFVKKQLIDVIQWTEVDDETLAWRFPTADHEIQQGAQLTVRETQAAVFVDEGRVADVFGPGRYTIRTANLPVLTDLRHWTKGFESPFKSDVYFFSTRLRVDQRWGTPSPVTVRDADFGGARVRAFGIYSY